MSESLVKGEIVFDEMPNLPPGTVIRVTLRDTSMADAAAEVVTEQILKGAAQAANERGRVSFALPVEAHDARATYTLSAHVDVSGDGLFHKGDYINMQSYPVTTAKLPDNISIKVKQIKL